MISRTDPMILGWREIDKKGFLYRNGPHVPCRFVELRQRPLAFHVGQYQAGETSETFRRHETEDDRDLEFEIKIIVGFT